jgi:hypothetical protein
VQKNEPPSRVPALGPELATTNPQLAPSSAIKDGTNIAATAKLPANYLRLTVRGRVLRFGVRQCGRWHTRLFVSVAVRHDAEVEINAGLTSGQLPHFKTIVGFGSTRCKESSARALCRWKAHGLLVSADADIVRSGLRKQCTVSELKVNYR